MAKLDSLSPRVCVCVWPARGECAPPLLPPAKRRRLALAAGSSESLLGPGSPGPVTLVFARADAARRPGRGAPRATPRGSAFLPGPWDPESRRPGKVCRSRPAARPWDFHSRARPLPSASPWRLLEVGGGKQTQRKAKYYECSWGDFSGAGDRRAGAGARGRGRQQRAECEEDRRVCRGLPAAL